MTNQHSVTRRQTLLAGVASAVAGRSWAEDGEWPQRLIKIIVGFSAGSAPDISARIVAEELAKRLGQAVIVENKPGAAGNLGAAAAAKSPPDGYTLFYGTNTTNATNPLLYKNLPYDAAREFAPVGLVGKTYNLLMVSAQGPFTSYAKLVEAAREKDSAMRFASGGNGTSAHLTGELLNQKLGLQIRHIPYRNGDASLIDVASGQVEMAFTPVSGGIPYIRSGRLRAIAVTSEARLPSLPDVPTFEECGLKGFVVTAWGGLFCPSSTPAAVVTRLANTMQKIMAEPAIAKQFDNLGMVIDFRPPAAFAAMLREERLRWAGVVRISGARID